MITVLHRGGMPIAQMITILHRGGGALGTPKRDYVICARPLRSDTTSYVDVVVVVVVVVVDDVGRRISWLFQLLLPQQESIVAQVE